jgi:ribose transport system substrate-binding protein
MCTNVVREALPVGGKIVVFIGDIERQNAKERLRGFHDSLIGVAAESEDVDYPMTKPYGNDQWTVVQTYLDGQDPKQAVTNVRKALEEHPDVDCLVGLYGYNGPACLEVVDELKEQNPKRSDKIKIVAFDEHEATLDGVAGARIYATVVQGTYEYGFETVRLLTTLYESNEHSVPLAGTGFVFLPCSVIKKDDVAGYRDKVAKRLARNKKTIDKNVVSK